MPGCSRRKAWAFTRSKQFGVWRYQENVDGEVHVFFLYPFQSNFNNHLTIIIMKKFSILIFVALLPLMANAYDAERDGIYYNFKEDEAEVTYYSSLANENKDAYSGVVVIPKKVTYNSKTYAVTSIGIQAFRNCQSLTSITIPEGVTSIGNYALDGCIRLTSVTIPNSVTSIGNYAFRKCYNLTSFTIPNSVTSIGQGAFDDCSRLSSITIPNSVISIGESAFGNTAWYKNQPDGVVYAGKVAYKYKGTMPEGTKIDLEEGTIGIAGGAFSGCSGLTSITIPASVTHVGDYAFGSCLNLCSVNLTPNTELTIGEYAFSGAWTLGLQCSVNVTDLAAWCSLDFPNESASPARGGDLYVNGEKIEELIIPDGVENIGDYALSKFKFTTSVTIPATVKHFGRGTWGMSDFLWAESFITDSEVISTSYPSLKCSVMYIPAGTKDIYADAEGWKEMTLAERGTAWVTEGVTIVNNTIPGDLRLEMTMLDDDDIRYLKVIGPIDASDISYLRSGTGRIANLEQLDLSEVTLVPGDTYYAQTTNPDNMGEVTETWYFYIGDEDKIIKKSTTNSLGWSTVNYYCYSTCLAGAFASIPFQRVIMPNDIDRIGCYTFYNSKIAAAKTAKPIKSLGEYAFNRCRSLVDMNISEAEEIGARAFAGCPALNHVGNLGKAKVIGQGAFSGCSMLDFGDEGMNLASADSIYYGTFGNNTLLRKVTFSKSLKYIGGNSISSMSGSFSGCTNLNHITLPEGCDFVGESAFYGCTALDDVTLPTTLLNVPSSAFSNTPVYSKDLQDGIYYLQHVALGMNPDILSSLSTLSFREGTTTIANGFQSSGINVASITFPATLRRIGDNAFSSHYIANPPEIATMQFPNSLEEIGDYAFHKLKGITTLTIPESVTYIGQSAFADSDLQRVTYNSPMIPVIKFGTTHNSNIFSGCKSLEKLTIGRKVTVIPQSAFSGCGLVIVNSEERTDDTPLNIEDGAFSGCTYLQRLSLPENVDSIGSSALSYTALKSFTITENMRINAYAFYGCGSLTSVTINTKEVRPWFGSGYGNATTGSTSNGFKVVLCEGVERIAEGAFENNKALNEITLNSGLQEIGNSAFSGCSGLTSITIPSSVTSIGRNAFFDCSGLTTVIVPDIAAWCGITFYDGTSNPLYYVHHLFSNETTEITDLVIPDGVTSIGDDAFYNCSSLTSVSIPNSVTSIGNGAFLGCSGLTSIIIPDGVTSIGNGAFCRCSGLTTISIPANVSSIGDSAFENCNLTSVNIERATPVSITKYTFTSAGKATLYVPAGSLSAYKRASYWYNFKTIVENTCDYKSKGVYYKINKYKETAEVTSYPEDDPYSGNQTIQSSVTYNDKNYNVTSIGDYAFYVCEDLYSVTIPESVTSIGEAAFEYCINLSSITIPESVTSIGEETFLGCEALTSITIPGSLTTISRSAFLNCRHLTSVTINDGVKNIGENAFRNCISMTTLTIPCSVTSIGEYAFYRFQDLEDLKDVYCYAEQLPSAPETAFNKASIASTTLHVPAASLELYKTSSPWSKFGTIVALTDEDGIKEIKNESLTPALSKGEGDWYSFDGKKLSNPQKGANIIRYSDGTTRKVMLR